MQYRHYYCIPKFSEKENCYCGPIANLPEANSTEAATVDQCEERFHQAVDEALDIIEKKKAKRRTGRIITAVTILALLVVMILTTPDRHKHTESLTEFASVILNDAAADDGIGCAVFGAMFGKKLIEAHLENSLYIDNYVLFNIGKFEFDGESSVVSVGLFNHVFTKSRDRFRKQAKEDDTLKRLLRNSSKYRRKIQTDSSK